MIYQSTRLQKIAFSAILRAKMIKDLRIVFMGTPEFAVPSLEILLENKFKVVAVITAPDKPQGRGQKLVPSPVKVAALRHQLPVLQPANLKAESFQEELKSYQANLFVVVAFRMLPQSVWAMPAWGTFNLHASLLPHYRGAAPINWAIMNGETETGVTTFFLKHEIDTGSIIFQEKETIQELDDAGTLYERLMRKGAQLVLKTVKAIEGDTAPSHPQPEVTELKHAPKLFKENCEIRWDSTGRQVNNFVRGLSPYPAAWTTLSGKAFKIFRVQDSKSNFQNSESQKPGDLETDNKSYLRVRTIDGWVSIEEFQPEGKKRMSVAEYFRGNKL